MTRSPLTAHEDELLAEAESRMIEAKVSNLVVVDDTDTVVGVVQIYGH